MSALPVRPFFLVAAALLLGRALDAAFGWLPAAPWWLSLLPRSVLLPVLLASAAPLLGARTLPWRAPDRAQLRAGLALLAFALCVSLLGILALPATTEHLIAVYRLREPGALLTLLVIVVPLHAALGEELYYRGFLQHTLRAAHPAWGPLLAAAAFALAHGFQGWLPLVCFHFPLALAFGVLVLQSRSLPLLMVVHFLFDVLVFLVLAVVAAEPELGRLLGLTVLLGALFTLTWLGPAARRVVEGAGALLRGAWPPPPAFTLVALSSAFPLYVVQRGPVLVAALVTLAFGGVTLAVERRSARDTP